MNLNDICLKNGADKGTLDYTGAPGHGYAAVYERYFDTLRYKPIRLLEIGVWKGNSLRMWLECFPEARVTGVEIKLRQDRVADLKAHPRVTLVEADSRTVSLTGPFDIVVDDGSHTPQDQLATYRHLRPMLAKDGTYWVEEACRAAWMPFPPEENKPGFREALFEMLRLTNRVFDCRDVSSKENDSILFLMR